MKTATYLWAIFLIISLMPVHSKIIKRELGEIVKIDTLSEESEIHIYNTKIFEEVIHKAIWLILDSESEVAATFHIQKKSKEKGLYILKGYFTDIKRELYAGMKIAFEQPSAKESKLPDRITPKELPSQDIFNAKDRSGLLLIPEGPFLFGSEVIGKVYYTIPVEDELDKIQRLSGKKRAHYINIPSFYIDIYEITNQQFSWFLRETNGQPPPGWSWDFAPDLPVDRVSYEQAQNYCQWSGKRLLTELEWEKAARGPNIKKFLNEEEELEFLKNRQDLNVEAGFKNDKCITREDGYPTPISVKRLKDSSAYRSRKTNRRVKGLCGNVSEWTSSWFLPYRGNTISTPDYGRRFKVIRGGAYNLNRKSARPFNRRMGGIPTLGLDFKAGIRCGLDAH